MMRAEDRDWSSNLEQIDLEVSAAELEAAEQQLQTLTPGEVAKLRPEWVEAVVAKATAGTALKAAATAAAAAANNVAVPRAAQESILHRLRRFAAVALATLGINSSAAAITATALTAASVTVAAVLWQAGKNSNRTMPFRLALEVALRADQPDAAKKSALVQLRRRIRAVIETLQTVRDQAGNPAAVADRALAGLRLVGQQLAGHVLRAQSDVHDTLETSLPIARDQTADASARVAQIDMAVTVATTGIAAMHDMDSGSADVEADRANILLQLTLLANR